MDLILFRIFAEELGTTFPITLNSAASSPIFKSKMNTLLHITHIRRSTDDMIYFP